MDRATRSIQHAISERRRVRTTCPSTWRGSSTWCGNHQVAQEASTDWIQAGVVVPGRSAVAIDRRPAWRGTIRAPGERERSASAPGGCNLASLLIARSHRLSVVDGSLSEEECSPSTGTVPPNKRFLLTWCSSTTSDRPAGTIGRWRLQGDDGELRSERDPELRADFAAFGELTVSRSTWSRAHASAPAGAGSTAHRADGVVSNGEFEAIVDRRRCACSSVHGEPVALGSADVTKAVEAPVR